MRSSSLGAFLDALRPGKTRTTGTETAPAARFDSQAAVPSTRGLASFAPRAIAARFGSKRPAPSPDRMKPLPPLPRHGVVPMPGSASAPPRLAGDLGIGMDRFGRDANDALDRTFRECRAAPPPVIPFHETSLRPAWRSPASPTSPGNFAWGRSASSSQVSKTPSLTPNRSSSELSASATTPIFSLPPARSSSTLLGGTGPLVPPRVSSLPVATAPIVGAPATRARPATRVPTDVAARMSVTISPLQSLVGRHPYGPYGGSKPDVHGSLASSYLFEFDRPTIRVIPSTPSSVSDGGLCSGLFSPPSRSHSPLLQPPLRPWVRV